MEEKSQRIQDQLAGQTPEITVGIGETIYFGNDQDGRPPLWRLLHDTCKWIDGCDMAEVQEGKYVVHFGGMLDGDRWIMRADIPAELLEGEKFDFALESTTFAIAIKVIDAAQNSGLDLRMST